MLPKPLKPEELISVVEEANQETVDRLISYINDSLQREAARAGGNIGATLDVPSWSNDIALNKVLGLFQAAGWECSHWYGDQRDEGHWMNFKSKRR